MDEVTPLHLASLLRITRSFDGSILPPAADDLNLMHWNINHLTYKLHHVEQYVACYPGVLHVIAISETWLTPNNKLTFRLRDYQEIHSVRIDREGGGISIFVHLSICEIAPKVLVDKITTDLNHFLVVELPAANMTIAVPYRRPVGTNVNNFLDEFELHCLHRPRCVILGDFNLNQLVGLNRNKLSDLSEIHGFALANEISTRGATRICSGTVLDLCLTNMLHLYHRLSIVHNKASDHSILFVSINRKTTRPAVNVIKSKLDLRGAISSVEQLCNNNDIRCGNELNLALQNIVRESTSELTIRSCHRINKSHVDRVLILSIRERDRLFALTHIYPDNVEIATLYNNARDFAYNRNEQLKADYELGRIESAAGDARKTWKLYKEVIFNKFDNKPDSSITVNGAVLNDTVDSCNIVNDYFCTAGENLATSIISIHGYDTDDIEDLYPMHAANNWSFEQVNADDVIKVIKSLPNKKSTSCDKVPILLLKSTYLAIALTVAVCFNTMIETAEFPSELLKGRLKLIHKTGDCDIDNFRGLTLLPSVSRLFEELLLQQLYSYLESLNLFVGNQFGFLQHSSCTGAALQLVDIIKSNYRKRMVAVMFIDLKKAFDTVDPKRLVRKFKRLGLSDNASKLMMSYLQNRRTATTIGQNTSNFRSVNVGVPQGSKLGPLQFIVYINDLLQLDLIGQLILYADDAAIAYVMDSADSLQHAMQHDANLIHEWLCKNVLSVNADKTCYVTFGRARSIPDLNITIDGVTIGRVKKYKYLGLIIDDDLNFIKHVDHVKKQITPFISLMWRKSKFIPINKRKQLYFSFVQSHLIYMLPIYGECAAYKLKELQILQNRCIKALYRLDKNSATTYLYSFSLLPFLELVKIERIVHIFKLKSALTKNNFHFVHNIDVHGRSTRRDSRIHIFNQFGIHSYSNAALATAINDFNELDSDLRRLTCLKTFKAKVRFKVINDSANFHAISPYTFIN